MRIISIPLRDYFSRAGQTPNVLLLRIGFLPMFYDLLNEVLVDG
jgi:hypothetical protein